MLRSLFQRGPELKSVREIGLMREAGKLVAQALKLCQQMAKPGTKTIEIDQAVEALYRDHGATPLFKNYPGPKVPFPAVTCISLNEQVVHGIPGQRAIKEGDLLKIDTACKLNGWCGDSAVTIMVGDVPPDWKRLVQVGEEVLQIAIDGMGSCRWWSQVARRMQNHVQESGFHVVTQYVGHGIGRVMHENPQVPNFVGKDMKKHDFRLEPGIVLAVEPMVNMGTSDTRVLKDHWTVVTKDGKPSVHVEHTLAITKEGVEILTSRD